MWTKLQEYSDLERIFGHSTGKSFSEALILVLTNPQYDKRLFIELRVRYMKIARSEHVKNMLCTQIVLNVKTNKTICVQNMF